MAKDTFGSLAHLGFPEPVVEVEPTGEGGWLLRSPLKLKPHPPTLLHALQKQAQKFPGRLAFSEHPPDSALHEVQFGEFWQMVVGISGQLRSLCKGSPLMILSGNSIEHAVIRYAAMAAGIPAAPVSPGYSLAANSHEKLKQVYNICRPGAIFVLDTQYFAAALQSLDERPPVISVHDDTGLADICFADLITMMPAGPVQDLDLDGIDIDSPAQIMFTSGSTGLPKGVIHTHGNLVSNLTQTQQTLEDEHQGEDKGREEKQGIDQYGITGYDDKK